MKTMSSACAITMIAVPVQANELWTNYEYTRICPNYDGINGKGCDFKTDNGSYFFCPKCSSRLNIHQQYECNPKYMEYLKAMKLNTDKFNSTIGEEIVLDKYPVGAELPGRLVIPTLVCINNECLTCSDECNLGFGVIISATERYDPRVIKRRPTHDIITSCVLEVKRIAASLGLMNQTPEIFSQLRWF